MKAGSSAVYLFVYGTLRRAANQPMHALLLPATFVGTGVVPGQMYDLGSYPGAVFFDGTGAGTHGEVYLLHDPAPTLARLDAYEGCTDAEPPPHEYRRVPLQVTLKTGETLTAWAYLYQRAVAHLTPVPAGDWLLWREQRCNASSGDG